jgi:hypothetical protein
LINNNLSGPEKSGGFFERFGRASVYLIVVLTVCLVLGHTGRLERGASCVIGDEGAIGMRRRNRPGRFIFFEIVPREIN